MTITQKINSVMQTLHSIEEHDRVNSDRCIFSTFNLNLTVGQIYFIFQVTLKVQTTGVDPCWERSNNL